MDRLVSTLQGLLSADGLMEDLGRSDPGLRLKVICDQFSVLSETWRHGLSLEQATETKELACGRHWH